MFIKNLSHISISTKSLSKVTKFYVESLNLKIIHEFRNKKNNELYGFFISSGKKTFLEFFKHDNKRQIGNVFRHMCFEVKDIKKVRKRLIFYKPTPIKRGKTDQILQFFVKDLENNIIEFHQRDKKSKF